MNPNTKEAAFEKVIETHLKKNGYRSIDPKTFDKEIALFPEIVLEFIKTTQPGEWTKLEVLLGENTEKQVIQDLCKWLNIYGSLATLRHGFKCYGRLLHIASFKSVHTMNPESEQQYAANILGITRQLHYSTRNKNSLDTLLSLNGIPIATAELKNPMSGQTVEDAKKQYQSSRDPRELLFEFKKRTLVHFAVDTEEVYMTTRLAGSATHFLPFNKGDDHRAGNPKDPKHKTYRTGYLWKEILQRDSFLDILARFVHIQIEKRITKEGRTLDKETLIFPRYHQLEAVRQLTADALEKGVGNNYLIEHSAGSGKSHTIAWLSHRLASMHHADNTKVFDSVVVITDRVVLDKQLQDNIYQFEHKKGVVERIDKDSRQLAEALESGVPIIITTQQKFPFVTR